MHKAQTQTYTHAHPQRILQHKTHKQNTVFPLISTGTLKLAPPSNKRCTSQFQNLISAGGTY